MIAYRTAQEVYLLAKPIEDMRLSLLRDTGGL